MGALQALTLDGLFIGNPGNSSDNFGTWQRMRMMPGARVSTVAKCLLPGWGLYESPSL